MNYTDNTKEGMKKKRRNSILEKLQPMKDTVNDKVSQLEEQLNTLEEEIAELEYQLGEVEYAQEHIDIVYEKISNGDSVDREDLKECEMLYEENLY